VHSGGELLIDAVGGRLMEQPTASVFDAETGVDANADGLDANTIEFTTEHGLGYGDAIQYASSDTSNTDPVGGLTPGEIYRAIPRDATIIRLGSVLVTGAELSVYHSNTPITWHQAVELAEAAGGRLASLTSEAENNDALSLLPEGQEAWIGGTDQAKNGTWTWELPGSEDIVFWIDGQIVDAYSDWAEGAPDAAVVGMDFAAIENSGERSAGTWVTKTSEETLSYYVVASPNSDAVDLLKDQLQFNNPHYLYGAQPNDGGEFGEDALAIAASGYWFDMPTMDEIPAYIYIDGTSGEFKFAPSTGDTGWTFQAAVADAKNAGRVLAQPLTQTENDAIKQLMIDNGVTEAWLGGNDFNEEGTWVWNGTGEVFWQGGLDGEAVNGAFTNFASATQVIYDAGVIPIGGLVDGETYLVREIDLSENVLKLEHPDQLPNAPVDFDGAAIANEAGGVSVFNIAGHGFTNGQIVTYRAAKPLQFNTLDVDADSKTVTPHNENATFDIDNPDQQAALLTVGQQVVYAANATNSQWYWLPNAYEETSDQPFWPQGDSIQNDPPYVNWNDSAPTSINTQFSAVMIDDGTWKNVDGTLDITGYLLERPQFQVSPGTSKANYFADAVDGWKEVWPATITSEDEWEAALEAIGEKNVYLGGSDGQDANTWRWDSASPGPEAGQQFWDGKSKGDAKNGYPTFWADGEPNDSGLHNKETQLLMYYDTGLWNDVSGDQTHPWLVESNRFTFIPFSGTYEEALADAASQGGWLATIRSDEENEAALNALETASSGMLLWIGASLGQNNRDWMWVGSDTAPASVPLAEPVERDLTYTNWYAGEPNNFNNDENYIQMYADSSYKGMWNDNNGATLLGGYLLEKDGDFELITGTYNWNQAFQDAKERGGQLATINNSSEQELAQSKLGSSSVWIGGTDEGHEGTFKWVEMEGYQNWASNEPSLNGEQYAHLRSDGMWNDRSATSELTGYLLEIDGDYSIVTGTFTWVQAKEDAEARGGHLAIIDTAEKQQTAQLVARRFAYLGATANQLIDGLEAGEAYYVTSADGDNYQLSSSSGGTPIAISGQNKSSAVNHYLIPANQQPIEGLREGQSYYVIAIDEKSFRLAATLEDWAEGTSIAVSGNDNSGNGYSGMIGLGSTLGTEGLDLTDAGQGRHKFIVDLTEKGAGDQSFAFVSPGWRPPFDLGINHGEAKAVTTGGGGGLVGVGMPRAMATSEPDVGVSIEVGARLQGESVYVNSRTHANADSYVDNTFVGILVEAGNSLARTLATETSQVEVLGSIHADTDLHVSATNEDNLSAQATTNGGGLLPTQSSWSRVTHQYTTEVLLDDFARLSAGNELKIEAHSTFDDEMVSMAKAGGAIGNMKANTIEDTNSELTDDLKNLGVRIGTEDNPSTTSIDLAASYLNARAITLDAAVNDATASAYSEVRGAGLMTKRATATSRFYDDTNVTINDDAVLHASDELVIGANHRNLDIHTHANFYRNGKSGWFSLRTDTLVDTQSRIDVDDTVEILANSLELDALHDEVDVQTRLTYGRVDYSDAYDFSSSDYKDLPEDSSRNDSGSDSQIFNTLNEINFNATVHFKDRRYLQIDDQGVVTEADGITLGNGTITPGYQYQAGDLILVDPINYQSSGTAFNALNYLVSAETHLTDQEWALSDTTSNKLMGTPTLASASSVSVINDSLSPMEIQGIDLDPRQGNQAGLADSLTLKPDDGSIDTSQWAPGTETDSGQSLGLFRIENTNPNGSDLIISGDIDAGLGQIHLVTLGGDLLAGSTQTLSTHLTAAAIILDAPSGDVIGNPDGAAEPFTLEFLERPTYPDRVQRRDPDAYWRLGDTSGLEAVDQSGNDHNGTYGTDVELEQTGALVGGNTSVRFTGSTGSYVEGADFTPTGLDGQTVSGWFMV
ncbi:MAG: lectin-like protein, partial [Rubripirellula sp.]